MEKVRAFEQVFIRLMRRYKYLEKMHEEEMMKILVYLKVQQKYYKICRLLFDPIALHVFYIYVRNIASSY